MPAPIDDPVLTALPNLPGKILRIPGSTFDPMLEILRIMLGLGCVEVVPDAFGASSLPSFS
jgi:hypothetical protein